MIAGTLSLLCFIVAFFIWIDLLFITPVASLWDGIKRNVYGYIMMMFGCLFLLV